MARQTKKQTKRQTEKTGRPGKGRVASASSDDATARWTVRGVPTNVRAIAVKAAKARNITMGDWLAEAVTKHAKSKENTKPGFPITADLAQTVTDMDGLLADEGARLAQASAAGEALGRLGLGGPSPGSRTAGVAQTVTDMDTRLARLEARSLVGVVGRLFGGK